ncbi:DNA ligase 1 [Fonticula alba]|uniref:DNA ligase 1 n=1 Tax=Fonticula alba TaxID=691883 RepID=A0A058Z1A1_FONAL|nr:DNA ligase 1 [Fonticula alba]KCV68015.1 DNA ligase 1 [Fonticula alba]|eukprot:XP_009497582.1 DNA ligase 1 [Fonticula alba]
MLPPSAPPSRAHARTPTHPYTRPHTPAHIYTQTYPPTRDARLFRLPALARPRGASPLSLHPHLRPHRRLLLPCLASAGLRAFASSAPTARHSAATQPPAPRVEDLLTSSTAVAFASINTALTADVALQASRRLLNSSSMPPARKPNPGAPITAASISAFFAPRTAKPAAAAAAAAATTTTTATSDDPAPKPETGALDAAGVKREHPAADVLDDAQTAKRLKVETANTPAADASTPEEEPAPWPVGSPVPYSALTDTFQAVESTTKRLIITELLCAFFRQVIYRSPEDLIACVYLCINRVAPAFEGVELGLGESILVKAISESTGRTPAAIRTQLASVGDLGTIAQASRLKQATLMKPARLTVRRVLASLREIAHFSGSSSVKKKTDKISQMLVACIDSESKYLVRSLEGKLRIGLAEQTVLAALAHASVLSRRFPDRPGKRPDLELDPALREAMAAAVATVKRSFVQVSSYEHLVPALLEHGAHPGEALEAACQLVVGVPCKPMLAHPTKSVGEVLERFAGRRFTCEYKYDGERCQVHVCGETGRVRLFSRNLEDLSPKYPELAERIIRAVVPGLAATRAADVPAFHGDVVTTASGDLEAATDTGAASSVMAAGEAAAGGGDTPAVVGQAVSETPLPVVFDQVLPSLKGGPSFILDSEAVAVDTASRKILPFQVLSTRRRKQADADTITVQVCLYAFDLLHLDGRCLLRASFRERRALLRGRFRRVPGEFEFALCRDGGVEMPDPAAAVVLAAAAGDADADTKTEAAPMGGDGDGPAGRAPDPAPAATAPDAATHAMEDLITQFLEASVRDHCEGLMVKTLDGPDSTYLPDRRSRHWLKVKKDYLAGVGDSVDLAVIGGYLGRGKRAGRFGGYLLACWDEDMETWQSVCKIGTGFSDEQLEAFSQALRPHIIPRPPSYYDVSGSGADSSTQLAGGSTGIWPDVWFEPSQLWEVKCADLSLSPVHTAGRGLADPQRGISLRFPRFIRIREDKAITDATTASQIADLYRNQAIVSGSASSSTAFDEEDY